MLLHILEKLDFADEKNILIQGLPSSVEKQFAKLSFSKNVTPLLKTRKIDFALVFSVNEKQLNNILSDVLPALHNNAKLWIAYPKKASKIATDLDKKSSWAVLDNASYAIATQITIDHVWEASHYKTKEAIAIQLAYQVDEVLDNEDEEDSEVLVAPIVVKKVNNTILNNLPSELSLALAQNKTAEKNYEKLPTINKNEYIDWIVAAKKDATKQKRVRDAIDKLVTGKRNPNER